MSNAAPVKKGHPVLVTLLILFFVLIVLPIGLVYGLFYDPTTHTPVSGEADATQVVSDAFFDSFKNAKQEKALKLQVSQDSLNQMFAKVYQKLPAQAKDYVSGVFVEVNNDKYDFFVEAHAPLFNTRAIIKTTFSDTVNETSPLEGFYQFKFDDIRLGRLGGLSGLLNSVAKQPMTDVMAQLQSGLASSGLHMTVSWADQCITYKKADLLKDASAMLGNQEFVSAALTQFIDSNAVTFNPNGGQNLSFITDLTRYHTKEGFVDEANDLNLNLDDYTAKLRALIDAGVVDPKSADINDIYHYLVRGYQDVGASVRNKVVSLDFSAAGISDASTYQGAALSPEVSLQEKVKNRITLAGIASKKIARISEAEINEMLGSSSFVGTGVVLARKNGQNSEVVQLTFDNFNANILDGKMYFTVGMNINGYEIRAILTTTMASFENYRMTLRLDGFYLGQTKLSADFEKMIKERLASAFQAGSCASYDSFNQAIVLDFSQAVQSSGYRDAIELAGTPKAALIGSAIDDPSACLDLTIQTSLL